MLPQGEEEESMDVKERENEDSSCPRKVLPQGGVEGKRE
jgi:hypothetical protein